MRTTRVRRTAMGALGTLALALPLAACGADGSADASAKSSGSATSALDSARDKASDKATDKKVAAAFRKLERKYDARLGVHALDTGSGREVSFHADERFAYASTHKAFTAAAVLDKHRIDGLDKTVEVNKDDLLPHSPVTSEHVGEEMTLRALCAAAVRQSDNAADNLLLEDLGGPKALDTFLEKLGDDVTNVNRYERELNEATPGDDRDTTTPRAFAKDLRAVALGAGLGKKEREQLNAWMRDNPTGRTLIRAGFPKGWSVGDKSGAGRYASRGDIAVVRPPGKAPLVVAVLSKREKQDAEYDDKLVADAAAVVAAQLK
ncbi:class A beta-lactamase [Streptomyces sp. 891-h]|uniref:class A beta-lactamase n=1 Tax=unclassified Streptomyces TaxID=2593676 RepID=UPI001FAAE179|nr:class A beta-lactamase [Streptomyces sp. 891-h]UNZ20841.1 class A beta-lactamase [Streptomyces sp. 891-h]